MEEKKLECTSRKEVLEDGRYKYIKEIIYTPRGENRGRKKKPNATWIRNNIKYYNNEQLSEIRNFMENLCKKN